jgi:uncharacterized protein YkwD
MFLRPFFPAIALGSLILATSAIGCDSSTTSGKVISPPDSAIVKQQSKSATLGSLHTLEQSVHEQVNQYRKSHNLPPLTLDAGISAQARAHSEAMANGRVPFSHNGFDQRVKTIARSISYRGAAENVAYNQGYTNPGEQAVQGWIKSTGHRQNMEGQYDLTGIGIAKNAKGEYYFTQIFIRRR